jgi:long-chain acyl-CoA synthetase
MVTIAHEPRFGFDEVAAFLDRVVDLGQQPPYDECPFVDVMGDVANLGLAPGTAIVIALSNGRLLLKHYFAALLTGAVPLTVSPATSSARITKLAEEVGGGAVVAARLDPHRYGMDAVVRVGGADAVVLPRSNTGRHQPRHVLMLTSGTSGMFSACLHRFDSLVRNARRHVDAVGLRGDDIVLVNLPLFYSYALVAQAFAALVTGARLVISGPPFSSTAYLAAITEHAVTASSVTPTIARLLLKQGQRLPARLRMLTIGGDRIAPEHVADLLSINPSIELYLTYGLTEAGPRVSTLAAHSESARRHSSVGPPLDGVITTLRGAPGHENAGELIVTSDTVMVAKVGSSATGADRTLIAPGVIATRDLFRIDDAGYLYFEGRLSDFVVVRGEKVSLSAVRQFVQTLPGIIRCASKIEVDAAGETHFDLDVYVTDDTSEAEHRVRRAVGSFFLPGERPRHIAARYANLDVFQK